MVLGGLRGLLEDYTLTYQTASQNVSQPTLNESLDIPLELMESSLSPSPAANNQKYTPQNAMPGKLYDQNTLVHNTLSRL